VANGDDANASEDETSTQRPAGNRKRGGREQQATLDKHVARKKVRK